MGYGSYEKGYRIYIIQSNKMVLSRSVVFDEDKSYAWETGQTGQQKFIPSHFILQGIHNNNLCEVEEEQTEFLQVDNYDDTGNEEATGSSSKSNIQQSSPSSTPVKLRSIRDIYARCHICVTEP